MSNKEKQIKEMADDIRRVRESYFGQADYLFAKKMYEDGYRKASEVAKEIFAEIEKELKLALESNYKAHSERMKKPVIDMADEFIGWVEGKITALRGIEGFIAELKKKYESEGEK